MQQTNLKRRDFVAGAGAVLAMSALPFKNAYGQAGVGIRLEWNQFKTTAAYPSFINAIRMMRANTNGSDRKSWTYWSNIHVNQCPHGIAYFLAWHRGYLHYFQQTLREVSGNSSLMVPYWDYYKNPVMPQEFTDPATGNPLYVSGRMNTNVYSALTMTPFSIKYKNFQRGTTDSFEAFLEYRPHGAFHNVIGGYMAKMTSPMDPIFWLHHSQMDRLWLAWFAAGAGRTMPPLADPYWSGMHTYTPTLTMLRNLTYSTRSTLAYDYGDRTLPAALPPQVQAARIVRVQFSPDQEILRRPPAGRFPASDPKTVGNRRSVGGARSIALDENSVTVPVSVDTPDSELLRSTLDTAQPSAPGQPSARGRPRYRSIEVVLDNVKVLPGGQEGGYFYDVYLNLPESGDGESEALLAGGFGAFEIAAQEHHTDRPRLSFPATQALRAPRLLDLRGLTVSFVRKNGRNTPPGQVILIDEMRLELSDDPIR
jgi:tyrosinase